MTRYVRGSEGHLVVRQEDSQQTWPLCGGSYISLATNTSHLASGTEFPRNIFGSSKWLRGYRERCIWILLILVVNLYFRSPEENVPFWLMCSYGLRLHYWWLTSKTCRGCVGLECQECVWSLVLKLLWSAVRNYLPSLRQLQLLLTVIGFL